MNAGKTSIQREGASSRRGLFPALIAAVVVLSAGLGATSATALPDGRANVIRTWNDLALQTVRTEKASDAQAARLYAMVNVAMYDAVNGLPGLGAHQVREEALVPSRRGAYGDQVTAAAGAAHDVLVTLYPDQASVYDARLAADLGSPSALRVAGRRWGGEVATQVLAARANDGSSPDETQPAGSGPGVFRASWSGVQFRNLAPFAIADSEAYVSSGPPTLTSAAYTAAFNDVKVVGNAAVADPAGLATYQYWSLGGGSSQPPGAWVQVAQTVSASQSLSLTETARLFALETMAMADTVAPTYETKFIYRFWRPTTAIREADTDGNPATLQDTTWSPRAGTVGSSPEHWSGHSSFSAAAAGVLAGFFCRDAVPFTLKTDTAPGGAPRSYPSFSAAAMEAGRSRVLGGLHFEFSNQAGLSAGHAIAGEVLSHSLLLRLGQPTHDGDCPR
jgi:hypothetical protein